MADAYNQELKRFLEGSQAIRLVEIETTFNYSDDDREIAVEKVMEWLKP